MLGALMFASKMLMEVLPNIHLLGALIVAITAVYRAKALYPIYIYVFVNGLVSGFATWWIPYLYIWALLWAGAMLIPKRLPDSIKMPLYVVVCGLHGFLFGVLYAPAQALLFGLDFKGMLTWIAGGIGFDITHGISNLLCGAILILPVILVLRRAERITRN